ncbi:MAG: pyrroline-5-carboxylate reductase [candidate division Zixibacteria bacterium]|nr:pyrroline-5-carboxylate reductase [candidate division Zixibacteria bacterium]NIS44644.1 pyrroline-5-carboxylate reductase [candidate division Zixibacteria bacterium]NIU12701.1 pyrroline-5-carboxylate reductase [candidate division Zixibacteria bacterium]NIV04806.1 pyrroline-5-carboxylate reductase [candidate division Zixibacteria bacterium]NIW43487.1 pyrroline-5-carboxylate reductase [Gammaproteobacteria bacterium]
MAKDIEITFIGPGIMAEAMISGIIRQGVSKPEKIRASGPRKVRVDELSARYQIRPYTNNLEAIRGADVVVLSVKPQRLDYILEEMKGSIEPEAFILSIVAGASIYRIQTGIGHSRIIRSMPNTPAQIGEGITVWTDSDSVSEEQKEYTRSILGALGEEIYVGEEYYLDMATALSGTGPAYVFMFMEAMVDAGVHLGFPRRIAERLVAQTVRGSVNYYDRREDPVHLARLRNQVTSPGGTSAAALYYLEKAGFRTAISRAIWAAYERSQELGSDVKPHKPEND